MPATVMPPARTRAPRLRRAVREGLSLVLPTDCAGCGAWDEPVCADCGELVSTTPVRSDRDAPMLSLPRDAGSLLPVWSLADYTGPVRHLVVAWKRAGRVDVARVLLARAGRGAQEWAHDPDLTLAGADVVVVPAPSGLRRRLKGMLVAGDLADAVAGGLARSGVLPEGTSVRSADVLRRTGGRAHQSGLGLRQRSRNRQAAVQVLTTPEHGAVVVLVDDVLTTGATLASCARALTAAGCRVAGALVVAATPPPGRAGGLRPGP